MRAARALAVLILGLGSGLLVACGNAGADYGHQLVESDVRTRPKKLADGGQVAVSAEGGRVSLQWRDPDGESWSAPVEIDHEDGFIAKDLGLQARGMTAAVDITWFPPGEHGEEYDGDHTSQVLCHDRACFPSHRPEGSRQSATSLAGDGEFAKFGLGVSRVLLWTPKDGFHEEQVTGFPRTEYGQGALGPDHRSFAILGIRVDGHCRYDLYATEPERVAFTEQARSALYVGEPHTKRCDVGIAKLTADRVDADLSGLVLRIGFKRAESGWVADEPDLGLVLYPSSRNTMTTQQVNVHGTLVAIGSPDAHRVMVQYRDESGPWSDPREIARSTPNDRCTQAQPEHFAGGAVVLVSCYPVEADAQAGPSTGFALVSADGRDWKALPVDRPGEQLQVSGGSATEVGDTVLVIGATRSYLITAQGISTLDARLDTPWDDVAVTPDKSGLFLVTGNGNPNAECRPTWRVADLDGNWRGPAHAFELPAGFPQTPGTCFAKVFSNSDSLHGSISHRSGYLWEYDADQEGAAAFRVDGYRS